MLKVKRFTCNMLQENCYIVADDTKECVVIDCGAYYPEEREGIVDYIRSNGLKPLHLIATHGHIDHNFGNNTLYEEFGLQPEVHKDDESLMQMLDKQAEVIVGVSLDYDMPPVGKYFDGDYRIRFGNHELKVVETPGHSMGSVFFYCEEEHMAFSGDTLFRLGIGRTDFMGGSMFQIIQSLRMVCQLPDNTIVYPGHGGQTTIGIELAENPYLDR